MKDIVFLKVYCYPEVSSNRHFLALFETSDLKEVCVLFFISIMRLQCYGSISLKNEKNQNLNLMRCFCEMLDRRKAFMPYFQPRQLSEILIITNLWHAASRVWWMKLCGSDNHLLNRFRFYRQLSVGVKLHFLAISNAP